MSGDFLIPISYEAFEEENARLTAQLAVMRKALVTAESFIADELLYRKLDLVCIRVTTDPNIREARRALRAVRKALKEGK